MLSALAVLAFLAVLWVDPTPQHCQDCQRPLGHMAKMKRNSFSQQALRAPICGHVPISWKYQELRKMCEQFGPESSHSHHGFGPCFAIVWPESAHSGPFLGASRTPLTCHIFTLHRGRALRNSATPALVTFVPVRSIESSAAI